MHRTSKRQPGRDSQTPETAHRLELGRLVASLLGESCYLALRSILCNERGGELHPRTRVPDDHLKPLALALACEVGGRFAIVKGIEVVAPIRRVTTWP